MAKEVKDIKPALRRGGELERWNLSDVERLFEDWFDNAWSRPIPRPWRPDFWRSHPVSMAAPSLDVYEDKDDVVVKAEIPGLNKDEIDISLDGNTLTVKGEKKKEEEVKEENYYRSERMFGTFSRTIELPVDVKAEKVDASFKNGVLEIRLPKADEAKKSVVKVKVA